MKTDLNDESIIFCLAGLAVDFYNHVKARDMLAATITIYTYEKLIKASPGFLDRFKEQQEAILKETGFIK